MREPGGERGLGCGVGGCCKLLQPAAPLKDEDCSGQQAAELLQTTNIYK